MDTKFRNIKPVTRLAEASLLIRSPNAVKPRHAKLAVNLAGTMALFLISTYEAKNT